jgi:hypothetical protein
MTIIVSAAGRLRFNDVAKLKIGAKVCVSSGMGGCFTLCVKNVECDGIRFSCNKDYPSYLQNIFYTFDEIIMNCYLLMPSMIYGLSQSHIDTAIAAGYRSKTDIIQAIADSTEESVSLIEYYLKSNNFKI